MKNRKLGKNVPVSKKEQAKYRNFLSREVILQPSSGSKEMKFAKFTPISLPIEDDQKKLEVKINFFGKKKTFKFAWDKVEIARSMWLELKFMLKAFGILILFWMLLASFKGS